MLNKYRGALAGLCIYREILNDPLIKALVYVLEQGTNEAGNIEVMDAYCEFLNRVFKTGTSYQQHLLELMLYDDNPFTRAAEKQRIEDLDPMLAAAAKYDLNYLQVLYRIDFNNLEKLLGISGPAIIMMPDNLPADSIPARFDKSLDWPGELKYLAEYHSSHSRGSAAKFQALSYNNREGLVGIRNPDLPYMEDLIGCGRQKEQLCHNTEIFLQGYSANNILLYGPRGTGKSSMIKSLLNQYEKQNLRMVQINRDQLNGLPELMDILADYSLKFIIFIDDLSFEEYETEYKGLKAVLEGSLVRQNPNVLIYATSNRRHLVKEFFSDRGKVGEEVHGMDTLQEKLSLADRFGLCISFETPDKKTYLQMVEYMAQKHQINMDPELLHSRALEWERNRHGPSGRTARQFIDSLGQGRP